MGHYTGLLVLALLGSAAASRVCNFGSATTSENGVIETKYIERKTCDGLCSTNAAPINEGRTLHIFGCEERYKTQKVVLAGRVCDEDLCNTLPGLGLPVAPPAVDPVQALTCYVGLKHGTYSVGGVEPCDGACGTLMTQANGLDTEAFFCAPTALCQAFIKGPNVTDPLEDCVLVDGNVTGCCCHSSPNCNAKTFHITDLPPLATDNRVPIACYSGIYFGGVPISGGEYVACQGNCASLSYTFVFGFNMTLYSCDPATVCRGFGLNNKCLDVDNGTFHGCCCDSDACIDPTRVPPVSPDNPVSKWMECYVGVHMRNGTNGTKFDAGAVNYCNGVCASSMTHLNGYEVEAFFCAQREFCQKMDTMNRCEILGIGDTPLSTCCCDTGPNCNTYDSDIPTVVPTQVQPGQMIACYSGLAVNNLTIGDGDFIACDGDCASITLNTTILGDMHAVTLYTCDPATVCRQLGIANNCANINGLVQGCCCDSDVCINPFTNKFPTGKTSLDCFVGVAIGHNYTVGASMPCDGECGSFESTVNNVHAAGYFCAPKSLCSALDVHNECAALLTDSQYGRGCCCDWDDNCNAKMDNLTVPGYVPSNRPPLACYGGLSLNGMMFQDADRFMACRGDCGLITFSTTINQKPYDATIYTCDPTNVCDAFSLKDTCGTVLNGNGGHVSGCCCSWNDCLDITHNTVKPSRDNLECFVGFAVEGNQTTAYGASMACEGSCASAQTTVGKTSMWAFFCASNRLCDGMNMTNTCGLLFKDNNEYVTGCCCNDDNSCNIKNAKIAPPAPPATTAPDNRSPIACYSGLGINNMLLTATNSYVTCHGDCASATYTTSLLGKSYTTTIYSCDPVSLCSTLGMLNSCQTMPTPNSNSTVFSGCCCNWDDCIDNSNNGQIKPTNETKRPDDLTCLVGYSYGLNGTTRFVGSQMPCSGSCAAVHTPFNNDQLYGYFCAPETLCNALDTRERCQSLILDQYAEACCCEGSSNCNNYNNVPISPSPPSTKPPIACYSGIAVNGKKVTSEDSYMSCRGECGLVTFSTSFGNAKYNATVYACDPATVCKSLNMSNSCGGLSNGVLSGCCCDWNDCLDTQQNTVKPSIDNLQCFVGISTEGSLVNGTYGGLAQCSGQCGSVETVFNHQQVWAFFCATNKLCDGLGIANDCATITPMDTEYVSGCCCNGANGCNLNNAKVMPPPTPAPAPIRGTPIACYNGIAINGKVLTANDSYTSCFGQCMAINYQTRLNGQSVITSVYSCDPVAVCDHYGMSGNCNALLDISSQAYLSGCCCGWDDCIDQQQGTIKPKHQDSQNCFVGFSIEGAINTTYGSAMPCVGQCASLYTKMNGHYTYGFFCAPNKLCDGLNMTNHCDVLANDHGELIQVCCCNDVDNCNANNAGIPSPLPTLPPAPAGLSPIACYSGISLNNHLISAPDSYASCIGECSAISYTSMFWNTTFKATMFSCDPVALCTQFGMSGRCATIENDGSSTNLAGCCCSTDDCIDTSTGLIKPQKYEAKNCFVGLSVEGNQTGTYGESVKCDGQCGSVQTTVAGHSTWGFYCASNNLCNFLNASNNCATVFGNQVVQGCCCNDADNCNLNNAHVPLPTVNITNPPNVAPIACYSGISLTYPGFSQPITPSDSYTACFGDCASVTYNTVLGGQNVSATMYSCDPVAICDHYNIKGKCAQIQSTDTTSVSGCCCNWDDCLDTTNGQIKPPVTLPPNPPALRNCFVGLAVEGTNYTGTYGSSTKCNGQCGSLQTTINGYNSWAFLCASNDLCTTMGAINNCYTFLNEGEFIQGCCCNTEDDCNLHNSHVGPPPTNIPPQPTNVRPIVCYSGLGVVAGNKTLIKPSAASYAACFGDCGMVTIASTIGGVNVAATAYSCDPVSICQHYGMDGTCGVIQANKNSSTSISGCCCGWDDCLDIDHGKIKPMPTQPTQPAPTTTSAASITLFFALLLPFWKYLF
ncbi:unnamed protein product, partial [Mesorhabditis spiculigera]